MQKCVTVTHQQQIKTRICKNLALIRMQFWSAISLTNKLLLYNFNIISQIAHCSVYCELWKIALKLRGAMCRVAEKGHRLFFLRCENARGNLKVLPSKYSLCRCMCARTYLTKQLFNKTTAVFFWLSRVVSWVNMELHNSTLFATEQKWLRNPQSSLPTHKSPAEWQIIKENKDICQKEGKHFVRK